MDPEFEEASRALLEKFKTGELRVVVSEITRLELENAPEDVRKIMNEIPTMYIEEVPLTQEATELAQEYIAISVLDESKLADAQHVAIATVHDVDIIVSWNFRHMVNIEKIRGFNSVNLRMGYSLIEIRSPREVISYEGKGV